ncbi:unnamed protein product [Pedinophyceae sp. YPF-701]|nr:unnamed protein product [Pedinophyceae sp. YPF-701]
MPPAEGAAQAERGDAPHGGGASVRDFMVYEVWEGNERFFCGGRCVAGPDFKIMPVTAILVVLPTVVMAAMVHSETDAWGSASYALTPITAIWGALIVSLIVRTGCMDPGIIPRRPADMPPALESGMARAYEVPVNGGRPVIVRYNDTSRIFQPPRAHHCSVNDNCYDRFDHHCPWIGTTVARRNYRPFLLFVFSTFFFVIYGAVTCALHLRLLANHRSDAGEAASFGKVISEPSGAAALVLLIYVLPAATFVFPLTFFHIFLVSGYRTTYENFRYNRDTHPYGLRSIWANWLAVCCSPLPPPRINFRAPAPEQRKLTWWRPGDPWHQAGCSIDEEEPPPGDEQPPAQRPPSDSGRDKAAHTTHSMPAGGAGGTQERKQHVMSEHNRAGNDAGADRGDAQEIVDDRLAEGGSIPNVPPAGWATAAGASSEHQRRHEQYEMMRLEQRGARDAQRSAQGGQRAAGALRSEGSSTRGPGDVEYEEGGRR